MADSLPPGFERFHGASTLSPTERHEVRVPCGIVSGAEIEGHVPLRVNLWGAPIDGTLGAVKGL